MQKRGIPAKVYSDGDKSDFENLVEEADIIVKSPGFFLIRLYCNWLKTWQRNNRFGTLPVKTPGKLFA